ncbi:MAG: ABC-ATPase domain-containing protein [Longimicrobiales bacterium]|nr:ABC-ATPase domain-containing protein [Longimicrobiales bacterium]
MNELDRLLEQLRALDGKGYGAYKRIKGGYDAGRFRLRVEHVQGDPYATPSRFRAEVGAETAAFPEWAHSAPERRRATADFVNRVLHETLSAASGSPGSGKSGELRVLRPGQQVLERTSVAVHEDGGVEARFRVGLPAKGRRVLGRAAAELVGARLVDALEAALLYPSLDAEALRRHVETVEDAVRLRAQLRERGLVAFVADGARLPRRSGVDDRPMEGDAVVPFRSPDSLRVTLEAPNAGALSGMGVPEGMTLIVGGGYHGKSTLLRALERGVYDHIPGDGRERVVTVADAVKVRAEDGRSVAGTDISNFIGQLPGGGDTRRFRTENASGSTSQAAAIVEALEVGARALLLDEDTSATNFMIRDGRMQRLIASEHEPITPFIDRAGQLFEELGVSTIAVIGGSGDYFDVADTVIAMKEYVPSEVTEDARDVAAAVPTARSDEGGPWTPLSERFPDPSSIDARRGRRSVSIKIRSRDRVSFGTQTVELAAVEQMVEAAQTRAIANALIWARGEALDGSRGMADAVEQLMADVAEHGLIAVHPYGIGELAAFRRFELAAFLNRLRTLETDTP